jgi:hypothetical protein
MQKLGFFWDDSAKQIFRLFDSVFEGRTGHGLFEFRSWPNHGCLKALQTLWKSLGVHGNWPP